MNKILLKALRCFIMSDKLLCGKNSDKKRLSLYHHIKNILIRSWEYSWFKQILALYICSCILSHEVVRYLTKINLYNLMWKVFRWSQKDKSNTMRQKVPDFLIVFCPLMKLSEPGSDPCYLIELIIRHLGHPLEIKNKRWVWNILLKKIIWTFIAF